MVWVYDISHTRLLAQLFDYDSWLLQNNQGEQQMPVTSGALAEEIEISLK